MRAYSLRTVITIATAVNVHVRALNAPLDSISAIALDRYPFSGETHDGVDVASNNGSTDGRRRVLYRWTCCNTHSDGLTDARVNGVAFAPTEYHEA